MDPENISKGEKERKKSIYYQPQSEKKYINEINALLKNSINTNSNSSERKSLDIFPKLKNKENFDFSRKIKNKSNVLEMKNKNNQSKYPKLNFVNKIKIENRNKKNPSIKLNENKSNTYRL